MKSRSQRYQNIDKTPNLILLKTVPDKLAPQEKKKKIHISLSLTIKNVGQVNPFSIFLNDL